VDDYWILKKETSLLPKEGDFFMKPVAVLPIEV
jgi:hypothetical protein